jgi:sugar/nucleoside kinase (ribokinase family)
VTITVVGHLCLDIIHHSNSEETRSYGGIFFSLATLANLLGPKDTILPVFGVGKSDYDAFIERLHSYPNIDTSGIYKINGPTNQVDLVYHDEHERTECSQNIADPVAWKKIHSYVESDMVLVNMISGFDVTLETLDALRIEVRESHIPVYMDVHSLTLGISADAKRFHRPVVDWRRWLFWLHAVQMNETEAAALTPERFDETTLAKQALALNTKAMFITRGARGYTAFIDEHKQTQRIDAEGITEGSAVDATGCGDVFGAAYCAHYLKSKNIRASASFANRVAAKNACLAGSREIDKLSSYRLQEQIEQGQPA